MKKLNLRDVAILKNWWWMFVIQCAFMCIAMLRQGCNNIFGALVVGTAITLVFDLLFLAVLAIVVTLASLPEMIRKRRRKGRGSPRS
jgi:hypothetical protein